MQSKKLLKNWKHFGEESDAKEQPKTVTKLSNPIKLLLLNNKKINKILYIVKSSWLYPKLDLIKRHILPENLHKVMKLKLQNV